MVEWSSSFSLGPRSLQLESSLRRNFFLPFYYKQVKKFNAEEARMKDGGPSEKFLCEREDKNSGIKYKSSYYKISS